MTRKILSLIAVLTLSLHISCTSSDKKDEAAADDATTEEIAGSDDLGVEDANTETESEALDGEEKPAGEEDAGNVAESADDLGEDDLMADLGAEEGGDKSQDLAESGQPAEGDAAVEAAPAEGDQPADTAATPPPPVEEAPAAPTDTAVAANEPPPIEDMSAGSTEEEAPKPAPVAGASLKKIKDSPFMKDGTLLNAVYLAREGDTMESISSKIYGEDRAEQLSKLNPFVKKVKVGDKIYYNSPQRPTDNVKLLTFYEDMGLPPQIYTAKSGDNIRKVAKEFLGSKDSWKEVWATNLQVDSKGELPEGTELKYWPNANVAAPAPSSPASEPVVAQEPVAPPAPEPAMPEPMAPPQADPAAAAAAIEPPAPPPPPMPPPPAPQMQEPKVAAGGEQDQMMMMGGAAILLIGGLAMFILSRKRKSKSSGLDFNTATQIDHTHIR